MPPAVDFTIPSKLSKVIQKNHTKREYTESLETIENKEEENKKKQN